MRESFLLGQWSVFRAGDTRALMRPTLLPLVLLTLCHCQGGSVGDGDLPDASGAVLEGHDAASDAARDMSLAGSKVDAAAPLPDLGKPGCGFVAAAFCDTFESPSVQQGRARELNPALWSGSRTEGQLSTTRAMGLGMAVIPACRPGIPTQVWTAQDTLVCNPSNTIASHHLLVATAAQNYGQNSYRIRQPFDFAGRTGKIVFDATVNMLGPLHGWVSLAVTEDPISAPGFAIRGNDEGSIIPRNAVEVHIANFGDETAIAPRNIQIFRDYVDTVYEPPQADHAPAFQAGKLNHFEILISESSVEVTITPYSENSTSFAAPEARFKVNTAIPFSRGYVHLNVHNHAMLKYTQPDRTSSILNATVAQIDNVGFDGPLFALAREYEIPDSLVEFNEKLEGGDPYNPQHLGYDIGYVLNDSADGARQTLRFTEVDNQNVGRARLSFSTWFSFYGDDPPEQFAYRARLNGRAWHERKMNAAEIAFLKKGPTVVDVNNKPLGDPGSQGRLALMIDIPKEDLLPGENILEMVTDGIATSYPPLAYNIDLLVDPK